MNKQKRVTYFDIAKGAGVFLVLLGHLQGDTIFAYSPHILTLCQWIFSFHMPLFFIISGMLINYKKDNEKNLNELIKKRFRSIMIPYFWFSFIYICIVLYSLIIKNVVPLNTLFVQLWYVFGMYGMNVLWFLPALFAGEIIFIYITQHFKNKKSIFAYFIILFAAIVLNYLLKLLPNNLAIFKRLNEFGTTLIRPLFACTFICAGFYLFKLISWLESKLSNSKFVILAFSIVFFVINLFTYRHNLPVDFRSLVMNNYFLYYLSAISGSLFLILLCKVLSSVSIGNIINEQNSFPVLKFFGKNSLVFMAVHNNSAILTLALKSAMYINQFLTRARGYICYAIVVTIITIYVCLTILIINRFFPFLTGKPFSLFKKAED